MDGGEPSGFSIHVYECGSLDAIAPQLASLHLFNHLIGGRQQRFLDHKQPRIDTDLPMALGEARAIADPSLPPPQTRAARRSAGENRAPSARHLPRQANMNVDVAKPKTQPYIAGSAAILSVGRRRLSTRMQMLTRNTHNGKTTKL